MPLPIATVATGMPAGICTIECSESTPDSARLATGTPMATPTLPLGGTDESTDTQAMVRADLIAERVAIESYRQMILAIGDKDPTTRQMLVEILAVEEEHADDLRDFLVP